jgi:hypothetical protein
MPVCDRCGEGYSKGANYSTADYCGTCTFIHGTLPEPKVVAANYSTSQVPEGRFDSEALPQVLEA